MINIKINSSLSERKTDSVYGEISNYIADLLRDPKNFGVSRHIYKYRDPHLGAAYVPSVVLHDFLQGASWISEYKKFREQTGDDNNVIKTVSHFRNMIKDLVIRILPYVVRPEAGGDMNISGEMRVFLHTWKAKPATPDELGRAVEETNDTSKRIEILFGESQLPFIDKIEAGIPSGRFVNHVEEILSHELGHYINAVRSSGESSYYDNRKAFRAAGGPRGKYLQFKTHTKEYARSTEEWQARYTSLFHYISKVFRMKFPDLENDIAAYKAAKEYDEMKAIKNKYLDIIRSSGVPVKVWNILHDVRNGNFGGFYDDVADFVNYDFYSQKLDRKTINRFKGRVYTAYQEYLKRRDSEPVFKIFDMTMWIQDHK